MIVHLFVVASIWVASVEGAEEDYRAGRFAEAGRAFEKVLRATPDGSSIVVGPLYYNVGNCEFALGNYAVAALRFRQAWHHLPHDPRVVANLKLTEERLGLPGAPTRSSRATLAASIRLVSPMTWLGSILLLETIGLFGLAITWRARPRLRIFWVIVVSASLLLAGSVIWERSFYTPRDAIILTPEWGVREQPDVGSGVIATLGAGRRVEVLERRGDWIRVSHRRGSGWGVRNDVGRVVETVE